MAAERQGNTRVTREPSPDPAGVSVEAGQPEGDGLGNGKCFRLSRDDGTKGVLEQESPGSALYPVPAEQDDKYYPVFRHSGKSLEADPEVPIRMVSESKQTPSGLAYRTHRSLRQGRVLEDWRDHSLLDDGRGRRKTAFV
eukprot:1167797-Prorocentrum_minimum.AAC.1